MRFAFVVTLLCALSGCSETPAQQVALVQASATLASTAAAAGMLPESVVSSGALFCGKAVSPTGVLTTDLVEMAVTASGAPASVVGAGAEMVRQACPSGTVPGAIPPGFNPADVAVVQAAAALLPLL
jgi:hypothetical protein